MGKLEMDKSADMQRQQKVFMPRGGSGARNNWTATGRRCPRRQFASMSEAKCQSQSRMARILIDSGIVGSHNQYTSGLAADDLVGTLILRDHVTIHLTYTMCVHGVLTSGQGHAQYNNTPFVYELLEHTKQDVCVEAPLMSLIQHNNRVLLQLWVI